MAAQPFTSPSASRETFYFAKSMSECTRKRKHQAQEDEDFDPSNSQVHDENNKTRRINPYKLAERLPEGLVKEMETFIKPGATMPSFEIRKELQIRYQVDRRHLYDYFHSRGLRVAKEDRHSNLTRSRIAKAKVLAQSQGSDIKENIPVKPVKPIKLPPAKRTLMETARKITKKPVLTDCDISSVPKPSANTLHQDTETIYFTDEKISPDGMNTEDQDIPEGTFLTSVDCDTDIALHTAASSFENQLPSYEDSTFCSGHSTPSLAGDISSCRPTPPRLSDYTEEPQLEEIAAEFLNLSPESEDADFSLMDPLWDFPSAPSIIGDLTSSLDRNDMYAHIDSSIVSTGSSFPLSYSSLIYTPQEKTSFNALPPCPTSPLVTPAPYSLYFNPIAQEIENLTNAATTPSAVPSQSQRPFHKLMPASSTSTGFCIAPIALLKPTSSVLLQSDVHQNIYSFPASVRISKDALERFHPRNSIWYV